MGGLWAWMERRLLLMSSRASFRSCVSPPSSTVSQCCFPSWMLLDHYKLCLKISASAQLIYLVILYNLTSRGWCHTSQIVTLSRHLMLQLVFHAPVISFSKEKVWKMVLHRLSSGQFRCCMGTVDWYSVLSSVGCEQRALNTSPYVAASLKSVFPPTVCLHLLPSEKNPVCLNAGIIIPVLVISCSWKESLLFLVSLLFSCLHIHFNQMLFMSMCISDVVLLFLPPFCLCLVLLCLR